MPPSGSLMRLARSFLRSYLTILFLSVGFVLFCRKEETHCRKGATWPSIAAIARQLPSRTISNELDSRHVNSSTQGGWRTLKNLLGWPTLCGFFCKGSDTLPLQILVGRSSPGPVPTHSRLRRVSLPRLATPTIFAVSSHQYT